MPAPTHENDQHIATLETWVTALREAVVMMGGPHGRGRDGFEQAQALENARMLLDPKMAGQGPAIDHATLVQHVGTLRKLRHRAWENAEACARGNEDQQTMLHNRRFAALNAALRVMGGAEQALEATRNPRVKPEQMKDCAQQAGLLGLVHPADHDELLASLERFVELLPLERLSPEMDSGKPMGLRPGRR